MLWVRSAERNDSRLWFECPMVQTVLVTYLASRDDNPRHRFIAISLERFTETDAQTSWANRVLAFSLRKLGRFGHRIRHFECVVRAAEREMGTSSTLWIYTFGGDCDDEALRFDEFQRTRERLCL